MAVGAPPRHAKMRDPLDLSASPPRLRAALEATGPGETALRRALSLADASPSRREWARFLSAALLMLGAALVLAGVVSFFAFNWAGLGRFEKFALLEASVAACALASWSRLDAVSGRVALFAAAVLVGPLLAVYGQTYQTGADPWGLFAAWALLVAPWVIAARFTPLWVLVVALVDIALMLFWWQVLELRRTSWMGVFPAMAAVHAIAVCAWEWQRVRPTPWLTETWGPRLMVATGFTVLLIPSTVMIVAAREAGPAGVLAATLIAVSAALAVWYYRQYRRDLFMLTAVAGSAFVIVSVAVGRVLFNDLSLGINGPLLMAMFIIGEVALAVGWLRRTLREWTTS